MTNLKAEYRDLSVRGKKLRKMGAIPCCIYGGNLEESLSIQIPWTEVQRFLKTHSKGSSLVIELEDKKYNVLLKDIGDNFIGDPIDHLGFQCLVADEFINSVAKIEIQNKEKNPNLIQLIVEEIPYCALPSHLVERIAVNVEGLVPGTILKIEDLDICKDGNIKLLIDPATAIINVIDRSRTKLIETSVPEEA